MVNAFDDMEKHVQEQFNYKGYIGSIEFSIADNCYHGRVQGLSKMLLSYEGNTLEELRVGFENCINEYIEELENVQTYAHVVENDPEGKEILSSQEKTNFENWLNQKNNCNKNSKD